MAARWLELITARSAALLGSKVCSTDRSYVLWRWVGDWLLGGWPRTSRLVERVRFSPPLGWLDGGVGAGGDTVFSYPYCGWLFTLGSGCCSFAMRITGKTSSRNLRNSSVTRRKSCSTRLIRSSRSRSCSTRFFMSLSVAVAYWASASAAE